MLLAVLRLCHNRDGLTLLAGQGHTVWSHGVVTGIGKQFETQVAVEA